MTNGVLSRLIKSWSAPLVLALALASVPATAQDQKPEGEPDATIEIEQAQFALLATVNAGGGKLHFKDETYAFEIGGLGVGGVGITDIHAKGQVFHLTTVDDFYGVYGQLSAAAAAGDEGSGSLWLKNTNGVVLEIDTENEGLILTMGTEGVLISR